MAAHAGVRWWKAREGRFLDGGVAITTVNAEASDVVLMAEGHRLHPRHILAGGIRRKINGINDAPETEKSNNHGDE